MVITNLISIVVQILLKGEIMRCKKCIRKIAWSKSHYNQCQDFGMAVGNKCVEKQNHFYAAKIDISININYLDEYFPCYKLNFYFQFPISIKGAQKTG